MFSFLARLTIFTRLAFGLKQRLKLYRILAKATDEKRTGLKTVTVIGQLVRQESTNGTLLNIKYHAYQEWFSQLNRGQSFSKVIREIMPPAEVMIIAACENSGKISDGFKLAANIAKSQEAFAKAFKSALVMPIINFIAVIIVSAIFCTNVLPQFGHNVPPQNLSSFSQLIMWICGHYYTILTLFVLISVGITVIIILLMRYYVSGFRLVLDKFPPFSLYRIVTGCAFLYVMNTLGLANIQQTEALKQMRTFSGAYLKYRIDRILFYMNNGSSFGQALINIRLNFPDKEIIDELSMYSLHGNIDGSLNDIVNSMQEDALELVKIQAEITKYIGLAVVSSIITFLGSGLYSLIGDMAH